MKNLTIRDLKTSRGNTATNQVVVTDTEKGKKAFFSYNTLIATYDVVLNKLTLTEKWDYSSTTLRYLKQFVDKFTEIDYINKQSIQDRLDDKENLNIINIIKE